MQLRCYARECEGIWAVPHRRDPYRVADIDGRESSQGQARRSQTGPDGARRSQTEPDVCRYASDAPSKPDEAWRSSEGELMSWYGETASPLQETEHVTDPLVSAFVDAGEY